MTTPVVPPGGRSLQGLVGRRVRRHRNGLGLTRRMLAERSRVSERYLAQLENGEGNSSLALLNRVAHALDVPVSDLVREHDGPGAEERLIGEFVSGLSAEDRRIALELLHRRFAPSTQARNRVALIGLRGAGKSTLGRAMSAELGVSFVRLGAEVERLAGMDVAEIVELSGQSGYRRLEEQALLRTLARSEPCVLEAGGGIVTEDRLLNLLLSTCFVVWVRAAPEEHMQRVIDQGDLRPMANNDDAMSDLRRLLREREPLYRRAHQTLDTSSRPVAECLTELCASVREQALLAAAPELALKSAAETASA